MVVLKKVKASTLMETLVATVLIIVVFMIASMTLNNLFASSIKNDTRAIDTHLNELQYLYLNEKLTLPYRDDFSSWRISIEVVEDKLSNNIVFNAINRNTNKTVEIYILEN